MNLAYDRRGAGEPVVLVHGLGDRREPWEPVVDVLAAHRDVVTVDLPGFGSSPSLPSGVAWSVEAMADAVAGLAARLGLGRWHVAGNSLGGGVALVLAANGAVSSAVAISPIGFGTPRERAYARAVLRGTRVAGRALGPVADPVMATAAGRTLAAWHMQARPWRADAAVMAQRLRGVGEATGFEAMLEPTMAWMPPPRIDVPLTIAWGERDRLLLFGRQAGRARRWYPAARHLTLPGCGHLPMTDDPEAVAGVVLAGGAGAPAPEVSAGAAALPASTLSASGAALPASALSAGASEGAGAGGAAARTSALSARVGKGAGQGS
jgi:pimeloyl-ACP methyl ester carboxylesterase